MAGQFLKSVGGFRKVVSISVSEGGDVILAVEANSNMVTLMN